MIFFKMVSNFSVFEGIFEAKFQGWFFFVPNNFYVDFFCKIEGEFNFLVNFFLVWLNFKGISFVKPALVLHVLYFKWDFFYNLIFTGISLINWRRIFFKRMSLIKWRRFQFFGGIFFDPIHF